MAKAPVTIDDPDDVKYEMLGDAAGYSKYEACGRMARVWSHCTERQTNVLTESLVRGFLGPKGPEAAIASEFFEMVDGGFRVRGTEGRIEWYAATHDKKVKRLAGKARASTAQRDERGRMVSAGPADIQQTPADASTTEIHDAARHQQTASAGVVLDQQTSSRPSTVQQTSSSPPADIQQPTSKTQPSESGSLSESSQTQNTHTANENRPSSAKVSIAKLRTARVDLERLHVERYEAVREEIGSDARALNLAGEGERWLVGCIQSRGDVRIDEAIEDCRRAVANREHQARALRSLRYFGPTMWSSVEFTRAIGWSSEDMAVMGKPRTQSARPARQSAMGALLEDIRNGGDE